MRFGWTLTALASLAAAANTIPTTGWVNPLVIKGYKFFDSVTGTEFRIKGIGVYPRANTGTQYDANSVDWFSDDMEAIWQPQLANLQALGVNTVRIYAVDPTKSHDKFMCALNKLGMYAFVGMSAVCEGCYILDEAAPGCYSSAMFTRAQMIYNAFAVYDNVIGFSVGNENNLGKTINLSAPCVKALIRDVRAYGQTCAGSLRQIPIGLDSADVDTEAHPRGSWLAYYDCLKDSNENTRAEWFGFNQYVECDPQKNLSYNQSAGLTKLMSDYAKSNYSRPIVFGEFGCIKINNTIDGIEQQRTFLDAKWMNTESAMTEYVAGGNAFEYSVEKANLINKAATPPFASADAGRYGIGYFTPSNCDFNSTPCVYNKYPEFDNLAKAYNATPASTLTASTFTPARSAVLSCPADFPTGALPGTPSVPILSCSVAQPVCNGGASNKHKITGTGSVTAAPQKKLVSGQSGGSNSSSDSPSTASESASMSLAFGTLIISTTMRIGWTLAAFTSIATAANTIPGSGYVNPLIIKGYKFFDSENGNEFRVKGISMYPRANSGALSDAKSVDWFSNEMVGIWRPQLENLHALGVNTVRIYAVDPSKNHDLFMCALSMLGMYAFVGISADCDGCYIPDEAAPTCYPPALFTRAQMVYNAFAVYDNVIGISVGNENNLGKAVELSAPCVKALIRDVRGYAQFCAPSIRQVPIGLDVADTNTEAHPRGSWLAYYDCLKDNNENTRAEWFGFNQYVECDPQKDVSFSQSAGLQQLTTDYAKSNYSRPIVFGEFGCIKINNTIDSIEQQRTFLEAKWMNTEPAMTEYVIGGNAFEYSVEKTNLINKNATPPFASADAGRYGIGYFTPSNCDFDSIPCVYNKYPEFNNLGKAYNSTPASTLNASDFTPNRTEVLKCPANFPKGVLPDTPKVTILMCSVAQPQCNGGISNTRRYKGTGSTNAAPRKKLVSGQSGGSNSSSDSSSSTTSDSSAMSLALGTLITSIVAGIFL